MSKHEMSDFLRDKASESYRTRRDGVVEMDPKTMQHFANELDRLHAMSDESAFSRGQNTALQRIQMRLGGSGPATYASVHKQIDRLHAIEALASKLIDSKATAFIGAIESNDDLDLDEWFNSLCTLARSAQ